MISYELKTPISAILMSLQLRGQPRVGALNEEQEQLSKKYQGKRRLFVGIAGELQYDAGGSRQVAVFMLKAYQRNLSN